MSVTLTYLYFLLVGYTNLPLLPTCRLQVSKLDAKLAVAKAGEEDFNRMHALREALRGELAELEVVITGKAKLGD